ncbi:MAG: arginine deiminase family protein, partial [Methanothrix sp.]
MEGRINAEWDRLNKVVVHRPGMEMFFGLLDPEPSLYERAFNQSVAQSEHDRLVAALHEEFGVNVKTLTGIIKSHAKSDHKAKEMVVDAALKRIDFVGSSKEKSQAIENLRANIDVFDLDYFLNIIMLMPRIVLKGSKGIEAIHINVTERDPLANLYFMRDQQAVTDKGIFLSRMAKPQRRHEPELTKMLWEMMGLPITHETTEPATFEGGDFMPMKDFALLGLGDRTNKQGVDQMLKYGQSFAEVAVVHQPLHPLIPSNEPDPMVDMHVDTYCNVAGSDVIIGSKILFQRAKVDVYIKEGSSYKMDKKPTNLYDYVTGKGFRVINLSTLEQMSYASNFLCIKDHTILAVNSKLIVKRVLNNLMLKAKENPKRYGALLSQAKKDYKDFLSSGQLFPHKREMRQNGIDFYSIDLKNITGGYGGAHCMT